MMNGSAFRRFVFAGVVAAYSVGPAFTESKTPLTVADLIGMTELESLSPAPESADRHPRMAIVVQQGNMARNTRDFQLLLWSGGNDVQPLLTWSTSSNRPAIAQVRWLENGAGLLFVGENGNTGQQVYALDINTGETTQKTRATAPIRHFSVSGNGAVLIYTQENERETIPDKEKMRARGFVVPPRTTPEDIYNGRWASRPAYAMEENPQLLRIVRGAAESVIPFDSSAAGFEECSTDWKIDSTGDRAVTECSRAQKPEQSESVELDLRSGEIRPPIPGAADHLSHANSKKRPTLAIEQDANTPWKLIATDPMGKSRHIVFDPNRKIFEARNLSRVTAVEWRTQKGEQVKGGLYWPLDYVPGKKYPVLIGTHDFSMSAFEPSGPATAGYAAQPIAQSGIFVFQISDIDFRTPREQEAGRALQIYESAIDALERKGLIDRARIGLHGWSRTGYYVLHFLTNSSMPVAASSIYDGAGQALYWATLEFGQALDWFSKSNSELVGGPPFGSTFKHWLTGSPSFNLDRIGAPLQLTAVGDAAGLSTLGANWEIYASLQMQNKPTELVYLPDSYHWPLKPWERMTAQQGAVDWYRFWLQDYEDSDPAKRERYASWRAMREKRGHSP